MEEVPDYILKSASTKDASPTAYRLLPSNQTVQSYIAAARGTQVSSSACWILPLPSAPGTASGLRRLLSTLERFP